MKKVVSLFDYTGNAAKPFAKAGWECYCLDIQHAYHLEKYGQGIIHYRYWDAETFGGAAEAKALCAEADFVFCWPPCTDVAVSGARWFQSKGLAALERAIRLFRIAVECAEVQPDGAWVLENPVSTLSTYWRKPDYIFDPCDYGDPYTKKTCLWTGEGFIMPPKNRVPPTEGSKMHLLPPSSNRANLRSATPEGFARAVYGANCGH